MRSWKTIDQVETSDGLLELRQRGERDFLITIAGRVLMTSTTHRSELEVARVACNAIADVKAPRVLIGGLGMAFTLREACRGLPPGARITVAELTDRVETWCRGPLSALTDGAVADPRVHVEIKDVAEIIRNTREDSRWHAIVLDLYEGPHLATQGHDDPLYGRSALTRTRRSLMRGGVLSIWSEEADQAFEKRLSDTGFSFEKIRSGKGGRRHTVYLARPA